MAAKKKVSNLKKVAKKNKKIAKSLVSENAVLTSPKEEFDSSKVKSVSTKTKAALVVAFIVIVFALYKGKGYFIAATVNNQPITRFSVISDLEKRSGKQALDSIITQTLIKQEAKNKGITVSSSDIDSEVSKIEASIKAQNQDLDSLLSLQGMSRADLRDQIQTQKYVEKILGSEINPTDKEIDDYIKTNKDSLPKNTTTEDQRAQVKDTLMQQKLSEKFQTWIADIKAKANIKYFVNY